MTIPVHETTTQTVLFFLYPVIMNRCLVQTNFIFALNMSPILNKSLNHLIINPCYVIFTLFFLSFCSTPTVWSTYCRVYKSWIQEFVASSAAILTGLINLPTFPTIHRFIVHRLVSKLVSVDTRLNILS